MKTKIILAILVLAVAVTAGVFGLRAWRNNVAVKQEQRAYDRARQLLQSGQPADAYQIVHTSPLPNSRLDWAPLEISALAGLRDAARLSHIFETNPNRVLHDEEASLVLARAYMSSRDSVHYNKIRPLWQGHETRLDDWMALDADLLTLQGKPREAEKLLRSRTLTGKAEAARLERLSLMVAPRDLAQAWQLLDQASRLEPRNTEIRSFRAQILEAIGRPGAAQVEYTAALAADQKNPLLRDQLADFYFRQGNYDFALKLWEMSLPDPTFDYVWLKAAFWGRMIRPSQVDGDKAPEGDLQPLVRWVASLPPGRFGDTNSFAQLPQAQVYESRRQEVFWLEVADALQNHREARAADLLKYNQFHARSWQPDLESALVRILHYRAKRSFNPNGYQYTSPVATADQHQFFTMINALAESEGENGRVAVPADFDALLRGPDAFAAAFLAAGWREAALNLCDPNRTITNEPSWFAYGLAQALRLNRGSAAAQEFIAHQPPDPSLTLLQAEMEISGGKTKEGIGRLPALAVQPTQVGYRASYLLALAALDEKEYDIAKRWVLQNHQLAGDVTGQDLLADIALQAGLTNAAERIYQTNLERSLAAREYFAKKAFQNKNWAQARELTTELIRLAPEQLQFRANLQAIDQAELSAKK